MNRRNLMVMAALSALTLATSPQALAAGKPDFSGEWKLNADKSDFGPVPAPSSQLHKIDHKEPVFKLVTMQSAADGDTTINATYTTDGKESKSDYRGMETVSVAKWDGEVLVVNTKVESIGATINGRWQLAGDGKTLTTVTKISTGQGDFEIKSVFEKVQ